MQQRQEQKQGPEKDKEEQMGPVVLAMMEGLAEMMTEEEFQDEDQEEEERGSSG
jgi:hypothetical protein